MLSVKVKEGKDGSAFDVSMVTIPVAEAVAVLPVSLPNLAPYDDS